MSQDGCKGFRVEVDAKKNNTALKHRGASGDRALFLDFWEPIFIKYNLGKGVVM